MSNLEWHPREVKRLAAEWGCSVSTVKARSAEASRIVMRAIEDPRQIRANLFIALRTIAHDARVSRQYTAAVRALEASANVLGLIRDAPRHESDESRPEEIRLVRYIAKKTGDDE
jgi:hypothetical protein